jgi:hypothetical protein
MHVMERVVDLGTKNKSVTVAQHRGKGAIPAWEKTVRWECMRWDAWFRAEQGNHLGIRQIE